MSEDNDRRDQWPTPGPNEPVPAWDEYDALRAAVEQYIEHEPPDPTYRHVT